MARFYQGPSLPQVLFSHHSCPTTEVWKQGTFHSTGDAKVLSNEVATWEETAFSLCWPGIGIVPIAPASYTDHLIL